MLKMQADSCLPRLSVPVAASLCRRDGVIKHHVDLQVNSMLIKFVYLSSTC